MGHRGTPHLPLFSSERLPGSEQVWQTQDNTGNHDACRCMSVAITPTHTPRRGGGMDPRVSGASLCLAPWAGFAWPLGRWVPEDPLCFHRRNPLHTGLTACPTRGTCGIARRVPRCPGLTGLCSPALDPFLHVNYGCSSLNSLHRSAL